MNWVKKQKLPAIESIQFNSWPCIRLDNLWDVLHNSFNSVQSHEVNFQLLDEITSEDVKMWALFLREELINTIEKCNNLLAPGPDKLSWSHIKRIIKNNKCITKLIGIANTCIDLGHWPSHFKTSMIIIIWLSKVFLPYCSVKHNEEALQENNWEKTAVPYDLKQFHSPMPVRQSQA